MLSALLNYIRPGSIENQNFLGPSEALSNAMNVAEAKLGIPKIVEVESIKVAKSDDQIMLLYLSYFVPHGWKTFLDWVGNQIPHANLNSSFIDGMLLGALVHAVSGGNFKYHTEMDQNGLGNVKRSMLAAKNILGIRKTVTEEQFCSSTLSKVARLSYLSQFYHASIKGSVSSLIPPAADKIVVGQIHTPTKMGEDNFVWVEVDCCDAGFGYLYGYVEGKVVGSIPVIVKAVCEEDSEYNRYQILFSPPEVDLFTFSIFYADEHVTGSPFLVNLHPSDSNKVKHVETSTHGDDKKDVSMIFDTANAGQGKLKANASGRIVGLIPIKVKVEANGLYVVTFAPPLPDIYTINVLWGKFNATAVDKQSRLIPLEVTQDDKLECRVTFKPSSSDVYSVDVNWDGKSVPGSPFTIDLLPPSAPEKVECTCPIYTIPGEEVSMLVDTASAGSGVLKAFCMGDEVGEVSVQLTDVGGKTYQVTFTPPYPTLYYLSITYSGRHIKGSPFEIDMQSGVDHRSGVIKEDSISVCGEASGMSDQQIEKKSEDEYAIIFRPSVPDAYKISDTELYSKPLPRRRPVMAVSNITCDPTKCEVIGKEKLKNQQMVQKPIYLLVDCTKAGSGDLLVTAESPDNTEPVNVKIKSGLHHVTYTPTVLGDHKIHFTWSDHSIPETPIEFNVTEAPVYAFGQSPKIEINTDCKQDDLKAHALHVETGEPYSANISKLQRGRYKIALQPKNPGYYLIHVSTEEKIIPSNPLVIKYDGPPMADKCVIEPLVVSASVNTPVTFTVNAKEAGNGELSVGVNIAGEETDEEDLTFRVVENNEKMFAVEFTPKIPGNHVFDIKWSFQSIPASPFTVHVTENDYLDNYPAEKRQLPVIQVGERNEENFPSSHFYFHHNDAPILEVMDIKLLSQDDYYLPDMPVMPVLLRSGMELDLSMKEPGMLSIKCIGDNCGEIPVQADETTPNSRKYRLKIRPKEKDRYSIYVKHNNKEIKKSPFIVDLRSSASKENVATAKEATPYHPLVYEQIGFNEMEKQIYTLPSNLQLKDDNSEKITHQDIPFSDFTQYIGQTLIVKVQPETDEQRNGTIDASVVGDITGLAKINISKLSDDAFILKFSPKEPDLYRVTVKLNGLDVPHTPFVVNYIKLTAYPSKCKVIYQEEITCPTEVGKEIKLLVDASNAGSGQLSVTFQKPIETDRKSVLKVCPRIGVNFQYDVSYTPNSHGYHRLNFTWAGEEIPDSPIKLLVVDSENERQFDHGSPVVIESHIDGKDLKLKIIHNDTGTLVNGKLTKIHKEKYQASFEPTVPGLYFLHIYANDKVIPSSPYVVKYGRSSKQETCNIVGMKNTCFLGEKMSFVVDAKETGDGELQVTAAGLNEVAKGEVSTVDHKDGTYTVGFTPEHDGDYKISVLWSEKDVPGSPFPVKVRDLSKEQLLTNIYLMNRKGTRMPIEFTGGDTLKTTTDQTMILTINACTDEQENSKLIATAIKKDTGGRVPIGTMMENNNFQVFFLPFSPGSYIIGAELNGEQIYGMPIYVEYTVSPPVASQCKIMGLDDHTPTFRVGKNISFQVDTRLAGNGKIDVWEDSPRDEQSLVVKSNSLDKHIIDITYVPNEPGTHMVKVAWSGEEIPKSPIYFKVEPIAVCPNGKPIILDLDVDAMKSDLQFLVFHEESGNRLKAIKINKLVKNRYSFSFKQRFHGLYSINVYEKMREIQNSPFFVYYSSPPNPEAVVILDVPAEVYFQESYGFTVNAKEAGISQLKVAVTPPKKGKNGVLNVTDHKNGIYTVEHVPEVTGNYIFSLVWDNKKIPDSPVNISVTKRVPSIKANLGPCTNIVLIGQTLSIDVNNVGMHEGEHFLRATARSIKSGSRDAPVIERVPGKCMVKFTPTLEDDYILSLFLHEKGISGSPFLVRAVEKRTSFSSLEHNENILQSDVECGKPTCLIVPCNDTASDDNTVITVLGPEGPCKVDINNQLKSSRGLSFVPTVSGDYLISIVTNDRNIVDTVFKIHAALKESDALKVFMTSTSLNRINDPIPIGMTEEYYINTSKSGYGTMKVRQGGEGKGTTMLRYRDDEIYSLVITPTSVGSCEIDVLMDEESIKGSPFMLQFISSPPIPQMCILENVTKSVMVNTPIFFTVNAVDAGSGELDLNVNIPGGKDETSYEITDNNDKTFAVEFIPRVPGDHVFDFKWSDQSIPGCPFTVAVTDNCMDVSYILAYQPLTEKILTPVIEQHTTTKEVEMLVGTALKLKVYPLNASQRESKLEAKVHGKEMGTTELHVSQNDEGVFEMKFNPSEPDHYIINVEHIGEDTPLCPFYVHYCAAPVTPPVPVSEIMDAKPVSQWDYQLPDIYVPQTSGMEQQDLSMKGPSILTAKCIGKDCGVIPVEIVETAPNSKMYMLKVVPKEKDCFSIHVKHNDKEVAVSPIIVDMRKQELVETEKNPVESHPVNEKTELIEMNPSFFLCPSHLQLDYGNKKDFTPKDDSISKFTQNNGQSFDTWIQPESNEQSNSIETTSLVGDTSGEAKVNISKLSKLSDFTIKYSLKDPDEYTVIVTNI